jgi:hypothetical protein
MGAYKHTVNNYNRRKRAVKVRRVAVILTGLTALVSIAIGIDWFLNSISNKDTIVTKENTSSVQSASVSVYRTQYFQFQAPEEWVFISSQSTDKKFVYMKKDDALVTQRFTVYVDRPKAEQEVDIPLTNVLPVERADEGRLKAGVVSTHCSDVPTDKSLGPNQRVVHEGVSFICSRDSKQYNVIIGELEEDEVLDFVTPTNSAFTLTMIYSDLTAYPNAGDIYNIISTFEVL